MTLLLVSAPEDFIFDRDQRIWKTVKTWVNSIWFEIQSTRCTTFKTCNKVCSQCIYFKLRNVLTTYKKWDLFSATCTNRLTNKKKRMNVILTNTNRYTDKKKEGMRVRMKRLGWNVTPAGKNKDKSSRNVTLTSIRKYSNAARENSFLS